MKQLLTIFLGLHLFVNCWSQVEITGYIFESGNRGYISQAVVTLSNEKQTEFYGQMTTDASGEYKFTVIKPGTYFLKVEKSPYFDYEELLVIDESNGSSVFLKHEIKRNPGYVFEITLAEKDPAPETPRDALKGALVEVYNNTKKREELVIENLESPEFKVDLLKGNHYTILIRKPGFLSKRMEAFVDVEGCILCFEGIGRVTPGVSDNLTEKNTMGVLLANVEMDRYFSGKVIGLKDIYYEFGKADITDAAAEELTKVADFLKDNPVIKVELGSHTDSRGGASENLKLSERRARSAVEYLVNRGGIDKERISARGYGEMQLTNNCGDGADCSEEEHQLNRRTELKVVDIIQESGYRMLRQMKADELMEEILADLDDAGQIKVQEGQNLEDAIASANGTTTILTEAPSDAVLLAGTPRESEEVPVEQISEPKIQEKVASAKTIELEDVSAEAPEVKVEEVKKESETLIEAKIAEEKADLTASIQEEADLQVVEVEKDEVEQNVAMNISNSKVIIEDKKETVIIEPTVSVKDSEVEKKVVEVVAQELETTGSEIASSDNTESEMAEWIRPGSSETFEKTSALTPDKKYSPSYSGYKVVVIFSRYELPKEHTIFQTYDDVDVYTTADGNKLYMLGSYDSRKAAEGYMNKNLRGPYPHSYVVGFEDGIRVY